MAISGHKDIRMLQRYSHTNEHAKRVAINKLGDKIIELDSDNRHNVNQYQQNINKYI